VPFEPLLRFPDPATVIDDPLFYALAVPAVLIAGISKGGFGGGLGVLAVPMMALTTSPLTAAAIMLPILCLMDLFGVWAYRRRWDAVNMRIMVPGALVGIAVGAATFRFLDASVIRLIIGCIAVGFALNYWLGALRGIEKRPRGPDRLRGSFWSAVAGFTSFVAHAGGPPMSVYLLPQRLDRTVFVATTVLFFIVVNYVKLVPYAWLDQFATQNLMTSLVLAPLAPTGIWLGLWLHRRVSERLFYRACYGFLLMAGVKQLWDGLAAQF